MAVLLFDLLLPFVFKVNCFKLKLNRATKQEIWNWRKISVLKQQAALVVLLRPSVKRHRREIDFYTSRPPFRISLHADFHSLDGYPVVSAPRVFRDHISLVWNSCEVATIGSQRFESGNSN